MQIDNNIKVIINCLYRPDETHVNKCISFIRISTLDGSSMDGGIHKYLSYYVERMHNNNMREQVYIWMYIVAIMISDFIKICPCHCC